jgi:hypothetical protein
MDISASRYTVSTMSLFLRSPILHSVAHPCCFAPQQRHEMKGQDVSISVPQPLVYRDMKLNGSGNCE